MADPWPEAVQRRNKLRPRPLGTGGILLVLVVVVVIFIGLVLWYSVNPADYRPQVLSAYDPVHRLGADCHQRHPQLARGAQAYLDEGLPLLERARFERGFSEWEELEGLLCRALAVEPDSLPAVVAWVELAGLRAAAEPAGSDDLELPWALLLAVHRHDPEAPGLDEAARAVLEARSRSQALDTRPTVR
jgi:hypothetical protein